MTDHDKWLKIRKELFKQMEAQVHHRLGEEKGEILTYRREYESEFNRKWAPTQKKDLLDAISHSEFLLMGDFHALRQSQKAHLRILKAIPRNRPIVLALECFNSKDQYWVNQFLNGQIGEREFLKMIKWQQTWGFPWENYRQILRWAINRPTKVKIYGINCPVRSNNSSSLRIRDQFAAKKIEEIKKENSGSLITVIYGDLHIGKSHIPAEMIKRMGENIRSKICRVFQNSEKIYFQILQKELEQSVDIVDLKNKTYCLMSVPPWVKWQNYLMYLEAKYDPHLKYKDDETIDYTDHVGKFVKIIANELHLKVDIDQLSVYTAKDAQLWNQLVKTCTKSQLKVIELYIEEETSFYLPEAQIGYLARSTVNHAAELAMQFIHTQVSDRKSFSDQISSNFPQLVWIEGISYFGSKIINHKRKADTLKDIKAYLSSRSPDDGGREAYQLALYQKMNELLMLSGRSKSEKKFCPKKKSSYLYAARLLGGMIGERLYNGYRRKIIKISTIHTFIKTPVYGKDFKKNYYKLIEIIEALPLTFKSKKDKL